MSDWLKQIELLGDEMTFEPRRFYVTQAQIDEAVRIEDSMREYRKAFYRDLDYKYEARRKAKRFWNAIILANIATLLVFGLAWLILR